MLIKPLCFSKMTSYPKRVAENILPLSVSGTLPEAFKEWEFTEKVLDHEIAEANCELCDQEELRYHFEIENRNTKYRLWVGSSCILKFEVQVFEEGALLDSVEAKKKLEALRRKMRLESCLGALQKLANAEANQILTSALEFYQKNKYLTPKFAFVVFWRLSENQIDHSPSFFKVSLKRSKYKEDLRKMPSERVQMFWAALSTSQRKFAIECGHTPPTTKRA